MIHECRIHCYAMDKNTAEMAGIEDPGKWMPFIFDMWMVKAAKMASDEQDSPLFNCTTVFTNTGDTYVIDTLYTEFFEKYVAYLSSLDIDFREDRENNDLDLDL